MGLLVVIVGIATGYKRLRKKKISPIVLIIISAVIALAVNLIFPSINT